MRYSKVMGNASKKESESDGNAPKTMIWKTVQRRAQRNSSVPATSSSCHHHGQGTKPCPHYTTIIKSLFQ